MFIVLNIATEPGTFIVLNIATEPGKYIIATEYVKYIIQKRVIGGNLELCLEKPPKSSTHSFTTKMHDVLLTLYKAAFIGSRVFNQTRV